MGDENCGFRVVAVTELGGEEAWPFLRRVMFMEMRVHRPQYLRLYLSAESLNAVMFRIGSYNKGPAPYIHWLDAPLRLYSTTTFLNIAIAYYESSNGNLEYNCLVLPLRRTPGVNGIIKVQHICLVNRSMFNF